MWVDFRRCRAGSYVLRGHPIGMWSLDVRQLDKYACRLTFMHIHAQPHDSVHASAHEYTQLDACGSIPIDAGLDHTCFEVASSVCEAQMSVSLMSTRADSLTCTFMHMIQCMRQHMNAHSSMHVCRFQSMPGWIIRVPRSPY